MVLSCTYLLAPRHVCGLLRMGACLPIGCTGQDVFDALLPKNIDLLKGEQYSSCGTNHYPPDTGERHGHTGGYREGDWEQYVIHNTSAAPHCVSMCAPYTEYYDFQSPSLWEGVQGGRSRAGAEISPLAWQAPM